MFIREQQVFFVASASPRGRVNLSPKGYDTFRVLGPREVAYLDFPGSGSETLNHVREDGRITFMWCSFTARPLVLRVYCWGEAVPAGTPRADALLAQHFAAFDRDLVRAVILGRVEAVQTSCGYGVPLYEYRGQRETLGRWAATKRGHGELAAYMEAHAAASEAVFPIEPPADV